MAILLNFGVYDALIRGLIQSMSITSRNYIEIYKGTIPTDADDWSRAGAASDLLVTFNLFSLIQTIVDGDVQSMKFNGAPSTNPKNATATGTASYYAMFQATSPTNPAQFGALIGDVTVFGGTGTLQLDSLSITSGNPVTIKHWAVRLQN